MCARAESIAVNFAMFIVNWIDSIICSNRVSVIQCFKDTIISVYHCPRRRWMNVAIQTTGPPTATNQKGTKSLCSRSSNVLQGKEQQNLLINNFPPVAMLEWASVTSYCKFLLSYIQIVFGLLNYNMLTGTTMNLLFHSHSIIFSTDGYGFVDILPNNNTSMMYLCDPAQENPA